MISHDKIHMIGGVSLLERQSLYPKNAQCSTEDVHVLQQSVFESPLFHGHGRMWFPVTNLNVSVQFST